MADEAKRTNSRVISLGAGKDGFRLRGNRLQPMAPVIEAQKASPYINSGFPANDGLRQEYIRRMQQIFPEVDFSQVKKVTPTEHGVMFDYFDGTGYWWE